MNSDSIIGSSVFLSREEAEKALEDKNGYTTDYIQDSE